MATDNMSVVKRASAVIVSGNWPDAQILLVQEPSGLFNLPGGGQDPEDGSLVVTLNRELKEELSLDSSDYEAIDTGEVVEFVYSKNTHPLYGQKGELHGFVVKLNETAQPRFANEIIGMKWVPFAQAYTEIQHDDVHQLLQQLENQHLPEILT